MAAKDIKLAIGDSETKRTYKAELKAADAQQVIGKKLGEAFRGELIGLTGYEFQITGGSDIAGFPMRKEYEGIGRRKILTEGGVVGVRKFKGRKGKRVRKTIAGNTIYEQTAQINCKVIKRGAEDLKKHFGIEEKQQAEETKTA